MPRSINAGDTKILFILLFYNIIFRVCTVFQLLGSSLSYMWSIYMQPKYVTQSQSSVPFVLLDNEVTLPSPKSLSDTVSINIDNNMAQWVLGIVFFFCSCLNALVYAIYTTYHQRSVYENQKKCYIILYNWEFINV